VRDSSKAKEALITSMTLGRHLERKGKELNVSYTSALYNKIKTNNGILNEKVNDHRRNALEMEKAVQKDKSIEVLVSLFDEIVRIDPYYGKVLREIKKGYDKLNTQHTDTVQRLEKEVRSLKIENEELRKEQVKVHVAEPTIDNIETSKTYTNKETTKEKALGRNKSVVIPKLDLSKVKNKYAGEKVTIAQPHHAHKKPYIAAKTFNDQNAKLENNKHWNDFNAFYADLHKGNSKHAVAKFKKDV